jgi:hypothetical protein
MHDSVRQQLTLRRMDTGTGEKDKDGKESEGTIGET